MQGGRTLIIVGVVILVLVVIVGAVLLIATQVLTPPAPEPTRIVPDGGNGDTVIGVPEGMVEIVVAAQDVIPRGTRITEENNAVKMAMWPESALPEGHLIEVAAAHDRIARMDIVKDMPVVDSMLTSRPGDIVAQGSDAALLLPSGRVAYAMPVARWSSVAGAIQPGDHVDVLISMAVVSLDEEYQTELPNSYMIIFVDIKGNIIEITGDMGRLSPLLPTEAIVAMEQPREVYQRPRLITQMAVQDAVVLGVGDWDEEIEEPPELTEEGEGEDGGEAEIQGAEEGEKNEEEKIPFNSVTLSVTPQDALLLKYLEEMGVSVDLVIRSASDTGSIHSTTAVTLDYVFERYSLEVPPKLPYGLSVPIFSADPIRELFPRRVLEGIEEFDDLTIEQKGIKRELENMTVTDVAEEAQE